MSAVVSKQASLQRKHVPSVPIGDGGDVFAPPHATSASGAETFLALVQSLRLHQWAKNALVFLPLLLAGHAASGAAWRAAALTALALGLVASATYIMNDLFDLPHDRQHPTKRHRPLASGRLPVGIAVLASATIGGAGLALGWLVAPAVLAALVAYVVVTVAYSLWIKRIAMLDCTTLGALFTLRLILGIAAVKAVWSPWLLTFSVFLFTSLSFAKRYVEVMQVRRLGRQAIPGRGYTGKDGFVVMSFGVAASIASLVIFILYLANEAFRNAALAAPMALWVFPPVLFLWMGRVWLLAGRGLMNDDPVAFAVRDRISLMLGALVAMAFYVAAAGAPFLP